MKRNKRYVKNGLFFKKSKERNYKQMNCSTTQRDAMSLYIIEASKEPKNKINTHGCRNS